MKLQLRDALGMCYKTYTVNDLGLKICDTSIEIDLLNVQIEQMFALITAQLLYINENNYMKLEIDNLLNDTENKINNILNLIISGLIKKNDTISVSDKIKKEINIIDTLNNEISLNNEYEIYINDAINKLSEEYRKTEEIYDDIK
jgi:hypothetical protein